MWYSPSDYLPASGERVKVMLSNGEETELIYKDNLWWLSDMSMYVYYVPYRWKRMGV